MNENQVNVTVSTLAKIGTYAAIAIVGTALRNRKLKKNAITPKGEALKINRDTLVWLFNEGATLEPAERNKQLNERIDFARFIANH